LSMSLPATRNEHAVSGIRAGPSNRSNWTSISRANSLWRALRQDVEGNLVQINVLDDRLRGYCSRPEQGNSLPESLQGGYRVIHFVSADWPRAFPNPGAAQIQCVRISPAALHLMGGIRRGGETGAPAQSPVQPLQQEFTAICRRESFLRQPGTDRVG